MLPKSIRISVVQSCAWQKSPIDSFRWNYLVPNKPLRYPRSVYKKLNALPIHETWAEQYQEHRGKWGPESQASFPLNYQYLERYGQLTVPIERTAWTKPAPSDRDMSLARRVTHFELFEAPFSFFLEWTKQKLASPNTFHPDESLYLAQFPIPKEFEKDLPTPAYVARIDSRKKSADPKRLRTPESTSLWMGMPPTETPLHKDPNENFFLQIAGRKIIRLLKPEDGEFLLQQVKRTIAEGKGSGWAQSSNIRGEEMMVGPERDLMTELLWNLPLAPSKKALNKVQMEQKGKDQSHPSKELSEVGAVLCQRDPEAEKDSQSFVTKDSLARQEELLDSDDILNIHEISLGPGDAAYIPVGWYHTVRSVGDHTAGINISANWWFRGGDKINRGKAVKQFKQHKQERAKGWKEQLARALEVQHSGDQRPLVRVVPSGVEPKSSSTTNAVEMPLWQQRLGEKRRLKTQAGMGFPSTAQ